MWINLVIIIVNGVIQFTCMIPHLISWRNLMNLVKASTAELLFELLKRGETYVDKYKNKTVVPFSNHKIYISMTPQAHWDINRIALNGDDE
jgi:hypothetical protein